MKPDLKTFYGTFGSSHTFSLKSVKIMAANMEDARYAMFYTFGDKFCTVYQEDFRASQFFQRPVALLESIRRDPDDVNPTVHCKQLAPEPDVEHLMIALECTLRHYEGEHLVKVMLGKVAQQNKQWKEDFA